MPNSHLPRKVGNRELSFAIHRHLGRFRLAFDIGCRVVAQLVEMFGVFSFSVKTIFSRFQSKQLTSLATGNINGNANRVQEKTDLANRVETPGS
ncbi:hypothetical protein CA13_08570 [Planctomycetes bacterium CA13]|uniref:Uncharacterized protein n=1 Tax=Novipirellula herctigrandis TaxID=2527986 RepID=A0A5C5YXG0_9BACT|nr:hypothetical protein CA13_08570 [Planctomycetes bacterium CA13]